MRTTSLTLEAVLLFGLVGPASSQAAPNVNQTAARSDCSNIVALSGARVDCTSLTSEQQQILKSIPVLLKKMLDKQADLVGLRSEMEQVYALVRVANPGAEAGVTITVDKNSNDSVISGNRAINVPLHVNIDNQSNRDTVTDNESIKDCIVADIPAQVSEYRTVSNESLRELVIGFSKKLREFASSTEQQEEVRRDQRNEQIRTTVDLKNLSPDQIRQLGIEGREISEKDRAELAAKIGEEFLGQATEYRAELRWRLQQSSLLPAESLTEMVYTFWPDPTGTPQLEVRTVQQTATYLENLARRLP